ncbi:MAG: TrfB-related DNA-binding protein [Phycisphaerales bacterium]
MIDGVETIVLTTKQPNRHSDRSRPPTATPGVDLLDKFVHKARPAAAAMGYFLLAMERTAQRLSKRHQAFVRRSWKLRPAQMDNQSPPVGIDDDVLLRELARLNEFEVAIARLCIVEGRTQVEVASLLGLTRPRVQKAVKSILTKLRLAIRPYAR